MTNVKDFFTGNFLRGEDCKGGEIVEFLAIGVIEEITMKGGNSKSVINYLVDVDGKKKTFSPNKANGKAFMKAWGEDDQKWIGKKFAVTLVKKDVFGEVKDSIVPEIIGDKAVLEGKPVETEKHQKMKIRNNTDRELVLYCGFANSEEPEATITLKIGVGVDTETLPGSIISIQEKQRMKCELCGWTVWKEDIKVLVDGRKVCRDCFDKEQQSLDEALEGQKMTSKKKQPQVKPIEQWTAKEWEVAYNQKNVEFEALKKELKGIFVYLHRAIGKIQEIIN